MPELEQEQAIFQEHLEEWRESHMGEFVLIKGSEIIGFYPTIREAFDQGSARYGLAPFFVRQITPEERVNVTFYGSRLLAS